MSAYQLTAARQRMYQSFRMNMQPDENGQYPSKILIGDQSWFKMNGAEAWVRAKLFIDVLAVYSLVSDFEDGRPKNKYKPRLTKHSLVTDTELIIVTRSRLIYIEPGHGFDINSIKCYPKVHVPSEASKKPWYMPTKSQYVRQYYIPPYTGKHKVQRRYPDQAADRFIREVLFMGSTITDEFTAEMHILLGLRRGYKDLDKYLDEMVFPANLEMGVCTSESYPYRHGGSPVKLVVKNIIDRDYQPDSETWRFVLLNLVSISG